MRFWLDTEFIDDGKTIDLLSIALVSSTGREYYAVSRDADWSKASEWVQKNVLPYLDRVEAKPRPQIRHEIERFIFGALELESPGAHKMPEIWAWYGAYDWVAFSQLWGKMIDLPDWIPHYVRDVKVLCDDLGNPRLPLRHKGEHHALEDAKWTRKSWEILDEIRKNSPVRITLKEAVEKGIHEENCNQFGFEANPDDPCNCWLKKAKQALA